MHKITMSVIGIAVAVVILVIAYRIFDGAGGSAKVGDIEVKVESQSKSNTKTSESVIKEPAKKKVTKQFIRKFDFKNFTCDVNENTSLQGCVDSGFTLTGMVGEVNFKSKDRCGSNFINFEKINDTCGNINAHLQGCGYDADKICISHAFLKGAITLQGYQLE